MSTIENSIKKKIKLLGYETHNTDKNKCKFPEKCFIYCDEEDSIEMRIKVLRCCLQFENDRTKEIILRIENLKLLDSYSFKNLKKTATGIFMPIYFHIHTRRVRTRIPR